MAVLPLRRASGYSIGPGLAEPRDSSIGPVDIPELPPPSPTQTDSDGTRVTVMDDGSVIIDTGRRSEPTALDDPDKFDANIAEQMDSGDLDTLAQDLIEGIKADVQSRTSLLSNYAKGIDLLALTLEEEGGGRQRKRTSKVRHPVMLDACTKFWASASAELLPASGPCKVRDDALSTDQRDDLAQKFQLDMNHYLTVTAREYYPDTAQMLMLLGFGGTTFKKVYHCPLRERPVSESVRLPDMIVNEQATDLDNAIRVTHQITMPPANVRRLQLDGYYLDIDLGQVSDDVASDPTRQKEQAIHGLGGMGSSLRPQDKDRTLYECYAEIDLADYGKRERGAPKSLPLPYRVTIDKDAQRILEIRRNWRQGDKKYRRRQRFVKWSMVPGFGFLSLGFLHLLGNQTRALTALWRIMIDCGMFANFPGGIKVKGTRQTANEIAPGPGEWIEVDTGPQLDIGKAFMPLPYKDLNPVMIQLSEMISAHADKLGTSVEFPSGEGRTNIPVGTIMAMIEQQTQTMAAVHRGLHRSQQEELLLLKELFSEDPESLWRGCHNPAHEWSDPQEFADCNLVPATDPNVPSQIHRIMVATALVTLATQNPDIYNKVAVHKHAIKMIGIADVDSYIQIQPQAGGGPNPELLQKQAELELHKAELALKQQEQQRKAASSTVEAQQRGQELAMRAQLETADRASKEKLAETTQETARIKLARDSQHARDKQAQQAQQHAAGLDVQRATAADQLAHQHRQAGLDRQHKLAEHLTGLAADHQGAAAERAHQADQGAQERQVQLAEHVTGLAAERDDAAAQRAHDQAQQALDRKAEARKPKPKPTSKKK